MLDNFQIFGFTHIISILSGVLVGSAFIILAKKYPKKIKLISIIFAITILLIRSVRYLFDINIGTFSIFDLLSIHVCNIDLILLLICLLKPNRNLFIFIFLIGIPTALSVVLMPGTSHPDPGLARAVFFIMSHTMLVMGALYLQIAYKYVIARKDVYSYYIISLIIMIAVYIFNLITNSNFMYLMYGPKNTVLEAMYSRLGPIAYVCTIYFLLLFLIYIVYLISKFISTHFTTINKCVKLDNKSD